VQAFAATLEQACIDTVEAGHMTKDMAVLTGGSTWLTTRQFLAKIKDALDRKLSAKG
jgi:isocitrate dehydrogenase